MIIAAQEFKWKKLSRKKNLQPHLEFIFYFYSSNFEIFFLSSKTLLQIFSYFNFFFNTKRTFCFLQMHLKFKLEKEKLKILFFITTDFCTHEFFYFLNRHRRTKYFSSFFSPDFSPRFKGFYFFALDIPSRLDDRLKYRVKKLLSNDQLSREHTEEKKVFFSFSFVKKFFSSTQKTLHCFLRRAALIHTHAMWKRGRKKKSKKSFIFKSFFSHFWLKKLLANATKS